MSRALRLGVLHGDGIGPEIVGAALEVARAALAAAGALPVEWVTLPMGWEAIRRGDAPMPEATRRALETCDGWVMGPHDSQSYPPEHRRGRAPSGELRRHFRLYANVRPARTFTGLSGRSGPADLVVVRENTEEFYADRNVVRGSGEWMPAGDVAISVGVFTTDAAERVARYACELARRRRRRLTIVHKANVIRLGMGLWLEACRRVAAGYPDVTTTDVLADAMAALLVRQMADFDVVLTTNMVGDILSSVAAELVGSLGLGASLNVGEGVAMAQAAHGAAPDLAGRDAANPTGEILSVAMLLRWLGERHGDPALVVAAGRIEAAVERAFAAGTRTRDLGGALGTRAFTEAVLAGL
ncbi:MAG: isocitrate/isopropylmalate family dehydrogenase [Armatimonadota bacterium]|nr:isocitrate/isopropylmalate family dehydrogenase [Armatimonadota bacterium]MDR7452934.1 isocitrate/isopropylmalate family dehydrogenase [Armatimonadota bacterium]MDR7496991.1 isocitrate/isopropylmalate family dehydrogenase [Armatimonadota bacterium]MDR7510755.1 isocitrate/isopropylmalate family dehydrogenase [Armatimonadota bacterium]